MRFLFVLAAAVLLSSCAWVRNELEPVPSVSPRAKPEIVKPHVIRPDKPAVAVPVIAPQAAAATPAPPDYNAKCREMADNRAGDAKQLGATAADQAKMQADTYRDCMAQSAP